MTEAEAFALQRAVDEIIAMLSADINERMELGAINWADLSCHDIEERRSLLYGGVEIVVMIEEASPDCKLGWRMSGLLENYGYRGITVETAW